MTVLLSFLFWFIGLVVGSFGLIQILICIRAGSAFTDRLLANGIITPASAKKIKSSYLPTIFLWSIIFLAATVCVFYFCTQMNCIAYTIGVVISLLVGLKKTGMNEDNWKDYLKKNQHYFQVPPMEDTP